MSFGYLPWPLYVAMALAGAIVTLVYAKKTCRTYPKTFVVGLVFIALGGIMAGIYKLTDRPANCCQ